jgi:APA family basic amino acid/polyamine antiporter
VCLTVLYLRVRAPDLHRPFRVPLYPLTPVLGGVMCVFLMLSLIAHDVTRNFFLIYLFCGMLVYFGYGMRHSRLGRGEIALAAESAIDRPHYPDV